MDAQTIINEAETTRFNPRQFREEVNLSGIINDVVKQFKEQE